MMRAVLLASLAAAAAAESQCGQEAPLTRSCMPGAEGFTDCSCASSCQAQGNCCVGFCEYCGSSPNVTVDLDLCAASRTEQRQLQIAVPSSAPTTTLCLNGVLSPDGSVCCGGADRCYGFCGGCRGCEKLPGGATECCPEAIRQNELACMLSIDVGCVVDPDAVPDAILPPSVAETPAPSVDSASPSGVDSLAPSVLTVLEPSAFPSLISDVPSDYPTWSKAPSHDATPSDFPTYAPHVTASPSDVPSASPSLQASALPTESPSLQASDAPSKPPSASYGECLDFAPSAAPSASPSDAPSLFSSEVPSGAPSDAPVIVASDAPTDAPVVVPSDVPSYMPSAAPVLVASDMPSYKSGTPTASPLLATSGMPSLVSSEQPTGDPAAPSGSGGASSASPSDTPSDVPTNAPVAAASAMPSLKDSSAPSLVRSIAPSPTASAEPSLFMPSLVPSKMPSEEPEAQNSTAVDPGDSCPQLTSVESADCPVPVGSVTTPCDDETLEEGDLCEGSGECFTDENLNNCGVEDIYRVGGAPSVEPTNGPRTCSDLETFSESDCPSSDSSPIGVDCDFPNLIPGDFCDASSGVCGLGSSDATSCPGGDLLRVSGLEELCPSLDFATSQGCNNVSPMYLFFRSNYNLLKCSDTSLEIGDYCEGNEDRCGNLVNYELKNCAELDIFKVVGRAFRLNPGCPAYRFLSSFECPFDDARDYDALARCDDVGIETDANCVAEADSCGTSPGAINCQGLAVYRFLAGPLTS